MNEAANEAEVSLLQAQGRGMGKPMSKCRGGKSTALAGPAAVLRPMGWVLAVVRVKSQLGCMPMPPNTYTSARATPAQAGRTAPLLRSRQAGR